VGSLLGAADGAAMVEFGLAVPILVAVLIPAVDLGMGLYQQMQVQNAAQAGAQYALLYGWNTTSIQNAVTAATTLSTITATPAPSQSCGCPNGTAVATTSCGSTCSGGQSPGTYVTVGAQSVYQPILPYPVIGSSVTLSAQAVVRIK
jgi:Flp pilus assembly protein TadG